jgi:hypothetical protein
MRRAHFGEVYWRDGRGTADAETGDDTAGVEECEGMEGEDFEEHADAKGEGAEG